MLESITFEDTDVMQVPLSATMTSKTVPLSDWVLVDTSDLQLLKRISTKKYPHVRLFLGDVPYSEHGKDVALSMGYVVGYNRVTRKVMSLYTQVY